jgi:hypothetical protein
VRYALQSAHASAITERMHAVSFRRSLSWHSENGHTYQSGIGGVNFTCQLAERSRFIPLQCRCRAERAVSPGRPRV